MNAMELYKTLHNSHVNKLLSVPSSVQAKGLKVFCGLSEEEKSKAELHNISNKVLSRDNAERSIMQGIKSLCHSFHVPSVSWWSHWLPSDVVFLSVV